jgi:hypothetical protein
MHRLKCIKLVENALEVLKICCIGVFGPWILLECLLSIIYYNQITNDCHVLSGKENLTNVMVYLLVIGLCTSLTATAYCCISTF